MPHEGSRLAHLQLTSHEYRATCCPQVEPALMEAHHMLPEDERLRATDAPERLQLQRGREPTSADPAEAAE